MYGYWVVSILLLTTGATLLSVIAYLAKSLILNTLFMTFIPILIGDILTILNFLPRDIRNIITGHLDSNGYCKFSAFMAIANCISLNINATSIAFFTYRYINNMMKIKIKEIIFVSCIGWVLGFIIAISLTASGKTGNFKGIYCCLTIIKGPVDLLPYFIICGSSSAIMIYYYYKAYNVVKAFQKTTHTSSKHVKAIMLLGMRMVINFYMCWTLVCFLAILDASRINYPIYFDWVAAWCLKLEPILDSVVILRSLKRILKGESSIERSEERRNTASVRSSDKHYHSPKTVMRSIKS